MGVLASMRTTTRIFLVEIRDHRRKDRSGTDSVGPDPLRSELKCQAFRERDQRGLADLVGVHRRVHVAEPRDRCHMDDRSALGLPQVRNRRGRHPARSIQIDAEGRSPGALIGIECRDVTAEEGNTRRVDQGRERPFSKLLSEEARRDIRIRKVGLDQNHALSDAVDRLEVDGPHLEAVVG